MRCQLDSFQVKILMPADAMLPQVIFANGRPSMLNVMEIRARFEGSCERYINTLSPVAAAGTGGYTKINNIND